MLSLCSARVHLLPISGRHQRVLGAGQLPFCSHPLRHLRADVSGRLLRRFALSLLLGAVLPQAVLFVHRLVLVVAYQASARPTRTLSCRCCLELQTGRSELSAVWLHLLPLRRQGVEAAAAALFAPRLRFLPVSCLLGLLLLLKAMA